MEEISQQSVRGLVRWVSSSDAVERVKQPVDSLPPEVLCKIFFSATEFSYTTLNPSYRRPHHANLVLLKITAVCKHWRSTALECATLWTKIAFSTSIWSTIQCARLCLGRSKQGLLSVYIWDCGNPLSSQLSRSSKELLESVSAQARRISICQLSSPSADFWRHWVRPAPNLRKLLVQGHGRETSPAFGGDFPRLEALVLQYCNTWPLGSYAALIHVELHNHNRHTPLASLLDTLNGCTMLESLILNEYANLERADRHLTPVYLPRLRQLDLISSDSTIILKHLDAPSLGGPVFILDSNPHRDILHPLPVTQRTQPYLQEIATLVVDISKCSPCHYVAGLGGDGSAKLYVGDYGMLPRAERSWITESLAAVASFPLFFNIRKLSIATDALVVPWGLWLPNLTRVEELSASCPKPDCLLTTLLSFSPDTKLPLLRSLSSLSLYRRGRCAVVDHTILVELILHRYRTAHPLRRLRLDREEWEWVRRLDEAWALLAQSQFTDEGVVTIELAHDVDLRRLGSRFSILRSGRIRPMV